MDLIVIGVFLFCSVWLWFRLWQDAENRALLSNLLQRNVAQVHVSIPFLLFIYLFIREMKNYINFCDASHVCLQGSKLLTVEDKLVVLGCKYVFLSSLFNYLFRIFQIWILFYCDMNWCCWWWLINCRDLERRIVEAEMELTLAKSQGYIKSRLSQNESSSGKKFLAVIGVYTGFGSHLKRKVFRGSWMPRG